MALKIETLQRLDLGIMGEHNANVIEIDCSSWAQQYPNGTFSLYHKRNGDENLGLTGAKYESETKTLTWSVTDMDTFYDGVGQAEIWMTNAGVVVKKKKAITLVRPAVVNDAGDTLSSNTQAYINEITRIKGLLANAAEAWAVGTRDGEPVTEEDETYHNNSKYYHDEMARTADHYIGLIQEAGAAAYELIPADLSFYASTASLTARLAAFGYIDSVNTTTLVLDEPPAEEDDDDDDEEET